MLTTTVSEGHTTVHAVSYIRIYRHTHAQINAEIGVRRRHRPTLCYYNCTETVVAAHFRGVYNNRRRLNSSRIDRFPCSQTSVFFHSADYCAVVQEQLRRHTFSRSVSHCNFFFQTIQSDTVSCRGPISRIIFAVAIVVFVVIVFACTSPGRSTGL